MDPPPPPKHSETAARRLIGWHVRKRGEIDWETGKLASLFDRNTSSVRWLPCHYGSGSRTGAARGCRDGHTVCRPSGSRVYSPLLMVAAEVCSILLLVLRYDRWLNWTCLDGRSTAPTPLLQLAPPMPPTIHGLSCPNLLPYPALWLHAYYYCIWSSAGCCCVSLFPQNTY